jgi:hypothetical protein
LAKLREGEIYTPAQCIYIPPWSKIIDEKLIVAMLLKKDFVPLDDNLVTRARISPLLTYLVLILSDKKPNKILAPYLFKITFILQPLRKAKLSRVK